MSKGAYYQGLMQQRGIATTGPDFGEISDKFTEKILAVQANQAAADKIAYQRLKDAADAKNAFLKEQREIGSKLFNRDKFDGTGIGNFDAMAEKAKASISAEFEGNNAMVDYIGQDAVRAKNNNIVRGYSDFLGVIQGAQEFMKKKSELDKDGLSSYTDDLKVNYLSEISENAKFDVDANGTVYITSISEDGKTERSVPLSEVKAMLYNDIGANVSEITSDILRKQEKGRKVFQVGTTEYTKYISGGQTELSKEATDLVRTATAGLSYAQKIDALSDLQKDGQSFVVSQDEYDKMSENERKNKIVFGVEDVFKKDKEAEVDRLLELGLSNKIFNELRVMESQEQITPKAVGAGADDKNAISAPVGLRYSPVDQESKFDANAIIDIMGMAGGTEYKRDTKINDTNTKDLNKDLYAGDKFNANAKVSAVSIPIKSNANELKSLGISSSSRNQWANITGFVVVDMVDDKGKKKLDANNKDLKSIRMIGSVSSKKITTKSQGQKDGGTGISEQTQKEELVTDISPSLSDNQLITAFNLFSGKSKPFRDAYQMILTKKKQNDSTFSENDPVDVRSAMAETIEYFNVK